MNCTIGKEKTKAKTGPPAEALRRAGKCVIVQECWPHCSFGSDTAYTLMSEAFDYLDAPVIVVSSLNCPFPYSRPLELLALPNADKEVEAVTQVAGK